MDDRCAATSAPGCRRRFRMPLLISCKRGVAMDTLMVIDEVWEFENRIVKSHQEQDKQKQGNMNNVKELIQPTEPFVPLSFRYILIAAFSR